MKKTLLGFVFIVSLVFVPFFPKGASALTLTPTRLEVSGNPGETVVGKMTVINDQNNISTYYSSFANFEAQGESGTPALTKAKDDLGTWISVPESLLLGAGDSKEIPVAIAIPKYAAPGGHFAAVFWGTQPANGKTTNIGIAAKTGMLVLLTVNGDISESANITAFDTVGSKHYFTALPVSFYYRFMNGGGDRIEPKGYVVVKDTIGITAAKIDGNPVIGNILPHSTRKFNITWAGKDGAEGTVPTGFFDAAAYQFKNFGFGRYTAHLKLAYGTQGQVTDSVVHFWVFPWQLLVLILLILLVLIIVIRAGVRHFEHWAIEEAEVMLEKKEEAQGIHFDHSSSTLENK